MESRTLFLIVLFQLVFLTAVAQENKKDAQLKNLEASVANARDRVALNEKKVADADSIINSGKKMIDESKTEAKSVDSDSRQLEKEYAAKRKPLVKMTKSKEKAEANRAKTELRALETEYKASNRVLETRLRDATKKQTTGISNIRKGRTSRENAMEALKVSNNTLKAVQKKYDAAAGSADKKADQIKERK
jgi:chromosome segregation ATPase